MRKSRPVRRLIRRTATAAARRYWPFARLYYRMWGVPLEGGPQDDVWYFAYGANMHDDAFRDRRQMRPRQWRVGRMTGYRLRFNLDGRPQGKAAPANIERDANACVWGVLYRISRRDLVRLDATEGVPGTRFRHVWAAVEDDTGQRHSAVTYMADGNARDGNPSLRYLTLLRDGARAHDLPVEWLRVLDGVTPAD